ncbi:DegT/DnrJ/EryC1/StrS family aminotransferase [Gammaproteobacteria bacterium]|nr:DegT/DnrJ/EryC1/StrS family aminotransferase [Gammaproteobacteria bacterium]
MIFCANPKAEYDFHRDAIDSAIHRVLESGQYILGKEVESFEQEFAEYIGVSHAVGVGSGTEALHIALRALDVGCGDEVITTAHTAVATASAIDLCGAKPVFVDIEPKFFTLNPSLLENAITPKTKAIIPVHIYGHPCNMDSILHIAKKHGLYVIEDCAQAHGAEYKRRRVGSIGTVGCFSFYPTKNLGAIGDGGAVVTDDILVAEKVRLLREYGWKDRYVSSEEGWNSRLDEVQAAILRIKLKSLDQDNGCRRYIASTYREGLNHLPLELPTEREAASHVYHLYVVKAEKRDQLRSFMLERGIQTGIQYPTPIHRQRYFKKTSGNPSLPVTNRVAEHIVSLPMYPRLSASDNVTVINELQAYFLER